MSRGGEGGGVLGSVVSQKLHPGNMISVKVVQCNTV